MADTAKDACVQQALPLAKRAKAYRCSDCSRRCDDTFFFNNAIHDHSPIYLCLRCVAKHLGDSVACSNDKIACSVCALPIANGERAYYEEEPWQMPDNGNNKQEDESSSHADHYDKQRAVLSHASCKWHCGACKDVMSKNLRSSKFRCSNPDEPTVEWCIDCTFRCLICKKWALRTTYRDATCTQESLYDNDHKEGIHVACAHVASTFYQLAMKAAPALIVSAAAPAAAEAPIAPPPLEKEAAVATTAKPRGTKRRVSAV
jgi:hypothetical protein